MDWNWRSRRTTLWWPQLSVNSSLTYADSTIRENSALPAIVGKRQPRVPRWRATVLATWRASDQWSTSFRACATAARSTARWTTAIRTVLRTWGCREYAVADLRARYRIDASSGRCPLGVDNLNNKKYWAFHPYTQRTLVAELKFDL
jgi:iron complex outermembrane receptor protein